MNVCLITEQMGCVNSNIYGESEVVTYLHPLTNKVQPCYINPDIKCILSRRL